MSIKSNEYNLAGSFKFVVSHNALDIVESSIPISILSSHLEITAALKHISFIGDITVQTTVNNSRFIEWVVTFEQNVGDVGDISIDMSRLVGQNGAGNITSSVDIISKGMIPNDYGFDYIYTERSSCGSILLGETSSLQQISLIA